MTQLRDYGRQIESDPMLGATPPLNTDVATRSPRTGWAGGFAWAVAAFVLILGMGALYFAFSGGDGQVVDQTTVPTPTTPESPFLDTWVSVDSDGSTPTMMIEVSEDGTVGITVHDDLASVCSGTPSTMSGAGGFEGDAELIIPTPVLTCDDGSQPEALSGPPLEEQLRNLTFAHDPESDTLTDNFGSVWTREGAEDPGPEPTVSTDMWPQSSLEEVREAQELADAGDPDFTWQVDPEIANGNSPNAKIVTRFLREELGWEEFIFNGYVGGDQAASNLTYMRCAPGRTNPVYPDDEYAGKCAPTIDELRYETVSVDLAQPVQSDPSGVWVVTRWAMGAPFSQLVPSTDEAATLVEDFLQARIEGEGAEQYLDVPLLYATTAGAPYERFEYEQVGGPWWPFGSMEFTVRLYAGDTVVEQHLTTPDGGGLGLEYGSRSDVPSTTENGQPLAVPDDIFHDGQVILYAPHPWRHTLRNDHGLIRDQGFTYDKIQLVADPVPVGTGCETGLAQVDAEALAESIQSDPDFEATAPVAVSLGGIDALTMDVAAASRASVCDYFPEPLVVSSSTDGLPGGMYLAAGSRMRLYLLDVPEGLSARILAIAVIAPEERFESVVEEATPILESIEFHTG